MADEFELIRRYLAPLAAGNPAALDLTDDAAIFQPPSGEDLAIAADAMVAGIHFLPDDPPESVGRKLLRVNLSDLAAMGARPLGYLTTLALPPAEAERWLAGLAAGLAEDQRDFGLALLGGDLTRSEAPPTISLTILGALPRGRSLRRGAARAGDRLFVSGSIGDATLGLAVLQGALAPADSAARDALVRRYRLPEPRVALGRALLERDLARAAIDLSDGLLADAGHVAAASGLGLRIEQARVPRSPAAAALLAEQPDLAERLPSGGDDYELLFCVAPERVPAVEALSAELGLALTEIGAAEPGKGVTLIDAEGRALRPGQSGWQHF